jgi:hypothetical protein
LDWQARRHAKVLPIATDDTRRHRDFDQIHQQPFSSSIAYCELTNCVRDTDEFLVFVLSICVFPQGVTRTFHENRKSLAAQAALALARVVEVNVSCGLCAHVQPVNQYSLCAQLCPVADSLKTVFCGSCLLSALLLCVCRLLGHTTHIKSLSSLL